MKKQSMPILNYSLIEDNWKISSDLVTWIFEKTDLKNGIYKENFLVPDLDPNEFPVVPKILHEDLSTEINNIPLSEFKTALDFANKTGDRLSLNCIALNFEGKNIIATNGHFLYNSKNIWSKCNNSIVSIPYESCKEIIKLTTKHKINSLTFTRIKTQLPHSEYIKISCSENLYFIIQSQDTSFAEYSLLFDNQFEDSKIVYIDLNKEDLKKIKTILKLLDLPKNAQCKIKIYNNDLIINNPIDKQDYYFKFLTDNYENINVCLDLKYLLTIIENKFDCFRVYKNKVWDSKMIVFYKDAENNEEVSLLMSMIED